MIFYGDWAPGLLRCDSSLPGDCALVNLEGPLLPPSHALPPAAKAGPTIFSACPPHADGQLVCSLANNHTMDHGAAGLTATLETLRCHGIVAAGAGATWDAARQPLIVRADGVRIAIIACCEAQFGAAQADQPGVAALGPWVLDAIRASRAQADAVVVSVHAGAELSPWPAPAIQDLYRSWIDAGATVVHGHHPHVPQGCEAYHGGLILYGLGNLAVNPADWRAHPNAVWSLAAEVDFAARPLRWHVRPLSISGDAAQVSLTPLATGAYAAYLEDCNRPLADRPLLEGLWQEMAVRAYREYYRGYLRFPPERSAAPRTTPVAQTNSFWRALCGNGGPAVPPRNASRQDLRLWYHLFACQTHNDLIATALGVLCGELPDLRTSESQALAERRLPQTTDTPQPAETRV